MTWPEGAECGHAENGHAAVWHTLSSQQPGNNIMISTLEPSYYANFHNGHLGKCERVSNGQQSGGMEQELQWLVRTDTNVAGTVDMKFE
jgi:hypothetical protein